MRTRIFILSFLLLGLGGDGAHAHAMLSSASPPVGGSVGAAPRQVTLSFTQGLEPSFSSVQVTDSKGARVDLGKPQISGSTMSVGLLLLHWPAGITPPPFDGSKLAQAAGSILLTGSCGLGPSSTGVGPSHATGFLCASPMDAQRFFQLAMRDGQRASCISRSDSATASP
jgi:copper resistance protein C